MDPRFRPALARRMAIEVLLTRHPRMPREAALGLAMALDDLAIPDDDDDWFEATIRDPFVEFRIIERDMLAALVALEGLGFDLAKPETIELATQSAGLEGT
jgi:hypothetical protein